MLQRKRPPCSSRVWPGLLQKKFQFTYSCLNKTWQKLTKPNIWKKKKKKKKKKRIDNWDAWPELNSVCRTGLRHAKSYGRAKWKALLCGNVPYLPRLRGRGVLAREGCPGSGVGHHWRWGCLSWLVRPYSVAKCPAEGPDWLRSPTAPRRLWTALRTDRTCNSNIWFQLVTNLVANKLAICYETSFYFFFVLLLGSLLMMVLVPENLRNETRFFESPSFSRHTTKQLSCDWNGTLCAL